MLSKGVLEGDIEGVIVDLFRKGLCDHGLWCFEEIVCRTKELGVKVADRACP